ncbi:MAG: glycosyltransferase family 9 protein [Alphaproteobacteria bacterium]|nr:glycosyltransferase family 9 protein [Alphaproteobacteria bacterium]
MAAFARLRRGHPEAHITLLTTPPFVDVARASPWFDAVESDGRPERFDAWLGLVRRLRRARYDRVYDLQANDRTNLLFQALRPAPPVWSGTAFGCALPQDRVRRRGLHALEREADQLNLAGVFPPTPCGPGQAPGPDVRWMLEPGQPSASDSRLVLLAPGAAARRPLKLWPSASYGALAEAVLAAGFEVAIVGGLAERDAAAGIQALAPQAMDFTGRTSLIELARLGAKARLAVGNDTGPMHLLAAAGAPSLVLFSADSDPALNAPRGQVSILRRPVLADLAPAEVIATTLELLRQGDRA